MAGDLERAGLSNLGKRQSWLGQDEPALASTQEAVGIYRMLAAGHPEAFLPGLAIVLSNLGSRQSGLGQRELAVASSQEALGILWPMFSAHPSAFYNSTGIMLDNVFKYLKALDRGATPELLARRETFEALAPK
jgi:hypothetical protein